MEWRLAEDETQRVAPDQVERPVPALAGHLVRILPEVSPQPEGLPVECVRPGAGDEGGERRRPLDIGGSIAIGEARPRRRTGHVEIAVMAGREHIEATLRRRANVPLAGAARGPRRGLEQPPGTYDARRGR